jgi:hypothetical protein
MSTSGGTRRSTSSRTSRTARSPRAAKAPDMEKLAAAKTTGEVERWLNTTVKGTKFSLGQAEVGYAKAFAASAAQMRQEFPRLSRQVTQVVTTDSKEIDTLAPKLDRFSKDVLGPKTLGATYSFAGERGKSAIVLNARLFRTSWNRTEKPNELVNRPGWFGRARSANVDHAALSYRHEMWHAFHLALTFHSGAQTIPEGARTLWKSAQTKLESAFSQRFLLRGGFVSRYARKNPEEAAAEIFAGAHYGNKDAQRQYALYLEPTLHAAEG